MKIFPFLLALGLAVSSLAAPFAVHAVDAPIDAGQISIVVAPEFNGVLRPGSDLIISGTVSNTTSQTTKASIATVFLSAPTSSRNALTRWLDPKQDAGSLGTAIGSVAVGELAPGQLRNFSVTIPAAGLGMSSSGLASYPIAVRLTTGSVELGVARTALVWSPLGAGPTVNVAVAMPLITAPSTTGVLTAAELAQYTSISGILTVQLNAALSHTVAIGVDPMILASIRLLGTSAPQSALDWLQRLAASQNDTFALGYADYDPALISQAGVKNGLAPIAFTIDPSLFAPPTSQTPTPGPTTAAVPMLPTLESLLAWPYTINSMAWPDDNTVVEADLDNFASNGITRTILSSSQLNPAPTYNPNATVDTHDVVVTDATLSGMLRAASNATTDIAWKQAIAGLGAELVAAAVSTNDSTLLATLGRDGSVNGPRLAATLTALDGMSWVTRTTLSNALGTPPVTTKLVDAGEPSTRVASTSTLLFSARGPSEQRVTAFSSVLADPTLITGPRRLALLGLLAQSWHSNQAGWNDALTQHSDDNMVILNSVHIPDSSTITLLQEKGNLPIAVKNELDFPVTVYVTVQPDRAILRVPQNRVELTIEPRSQAKASIPVESIANGEVRTTVSLTSRTNVPISTPTVVGLNVQAGWETAATLVLAAVVVVLFGAGIWRTVRRRRKARAAPAPAVTEGSSTSPKPSTAAETSAKPVSSDS